MRKHASTLFAFALLGTALLIVGSGVVLAHESETPDVAVIHITEAGFEPKSARIQVGQTILFENTDSERHWPASNIHPTHRGYPGSDIEKCNTDEKETIFDACRGLKKGETHAFTFTIPGTWKYHDHEFPQFGGEIVVEGEGADLPTPKDSEGFFTRLRSSLGVWFSKILYTIIPGKLERDLASVSLIDVAQNNSPQLKHWLSILGPPKVMEELLAESHKGGLVVRDCHQAAHTVGRESYEIYGNEVFQMCSAECHSGCYHGGTEAYFREHGTADLEEDLNTICGTSLNQFFSHQCFHGIGHGLMAWSNYELFDAIEGCDLLSSSRQSCYSGVFMENIVGGLAAEDGHFTEYLSDDPHYPCSIVPKGLVPDCYFLQTSRMLQLFGADWERVASECHKAPQIAQHNCFGSMGRDVGGRLRAYPEKAVEACSHSPTAETRWWCLDGAIRDTFWDRSTSQEAINFCAYLQTGEEKRKCYNLIFGRATQVFVEKKEGLAFCKKIEDSYQEACVRLIETALK